MKSTIGSRVARILGGGINALIDAIEDASPIVVLREAANEVDNAIDDIQSEITTTRAKRHVVSARILEINKSLNELEEKTQTALAEKRDDLAQAAIGRQLDIEAQIPILEHSIVKTKDQETELGAYLSALQAKKREMIEEIRTFVEAQNIGVVVDGDVIDAELVDSGNRVRLATSTFDRLIEKHIGSSGLNTPMNANDAKKIAELEDISRQNRINERLLELKGITIN